MTKRRDMQTRTYEFEIFEDEGFYCAAPYDFDGGTQGRSFDELCDMVAEWLKLKIEDAAMHHKALPSPTFGNTPRYGGSNVIFSVTAGLETVDKVSASEAAATLGVTQGRITQMIAAGALEGWKDGRNTYVTRGSVNARLKDRPKAGRPKHTSKV